MPAPRAAGAARLGRTAGQREGPTISIEIRLDDLSSAEVVALVAEHLAGMHGSMRTRSAFLRQGVGQAVLDEIVRTARARGYSSLFLETGTGEAFAAAHALYLRNGFEWCGPFADYDATDFNVFMVKRLGEA